MKKVEFNIRMLIVRSLRSHKFYKEFIQPFYLKEENYSEEANYLEAAKRAEEAMEVAVKLAINVEDDKYYKFYLYRNVYEYDYDTLIKDLGIQYGIYENESDFDDYYND